LLFDWTRYVISTSFFSFSSFLIVSPIEARRPNILLFVFLGIDSSFDEHEDAEWFDPAFGALLIGALAWTR